MTNCDPCMPEFPTPRDEWGFRLGDPWDTQTAADRVKVYPASTAALALVRRARAMRARTITEQGGTIMTLWSLVVALVVGLAGAAGAVQLRFDNPTLDGGTLTYDGAGGPAVASAVIFQEVIGIETALNSGVSLYCYPGNCLMDFATGDSLVEGPPAYTFAGGGALTLVGGLNTAPDGSGLQIVTAGSLLAFDGDFADPGLVLGGPSGFLFAGVGGDLKDPTLAEFYGIPATAFRFATTTLSLDAAFDPTTGAFAARVTDADFTNTAVPEPATLGLLGLGLVGLAAVRRHARQ